MPARGSLSVWPRWPMRASRPRPRPWRKPLDGRPTKVHRLLLRVHLDQIDRIDRSIAVIDQGVETHLGSFRSAIELVLTVPGMGPTSTPAVLGEIGVDMGRFPSEGQFMSWSCLVPRNDESAGKRRSRRMRKGGTWLKTTMVQPPLRTAKEPTCDRTLSGTLHGIPNEEHIGGRVQPRKTEKSREQIPLRHVKSVARSVAEQE